MANINLLPWREELRVKKNKEFISIVVVIALAAGAAVLAVLFFFNTKLLDQKEANQLIESKNEKLDKALTEIEELEERKERIIARMKVIQDLQGKRPIPVRFWDDLSGAIPQFLFLTQVRRDKDKDTLVLTGKADNPNIVSTFIDNLNASEWMDGSSVQYIEQGKKMPAPKSGDKSKQEVIYPENAYVGFEISTNIVEPPTEEEKAEAEKVEGQKAVVGASKVVNTDTTNSAIAPVPTETQGQVGSPTVEGSPANPSVDVNNQSAQKPVANGQNLTTNTNVVKEPNVAPPIVIQQESSAPPVKNSTDQNAASKNENTTDTGNKKVQENAPKLPSSAMSDDTPQITDNKGTAKPQAQNKVQAPVQAPVQQQAPSNSEITGDIKE